MDKTSLIDVGIFVLVILLCVSGLSIAISSNFLGAGNSTVEGIGRIVNLDGLLVPTILIILSLVVLLVLSYIRRRS
jgi:hypothetical protein